MLKSNKLYKKANNATKISVATFAVLLFVAAGVGIGSYIASSKIQKQLSVDSGYNISHSEQIAELDNQKLFGEITNEEYINKLNNLDDLQTYIDAQAPQFKNEYKKYETLLKTSIFSLLAGFFASIVCSLVGTLASSAYIKKASGAAGEIEKD